MTIEFENAFYNYLFQWRDKCFVEIFTEVRSRNVRRTMRIRFCSLTKITLKVAVLAFAVHDFGKSHTKVFVPAHNTSAET